MTIHDYLVTQEKNTQYQLLQTMQNIFISITIITYFVSGQEDMGEQFSRQYVSHLTSTFRAGTHI